MMPSKNKDKNASFEKGDRVRHRGEDVEGEVNSTQYPAPNYKVSWDDGYETVESFHTVEKPSEYPEDKNTELEDDKND